MIISKQDLNQTQLKILKLLQEKSGLTRRQLTEMIGYTRGAIHGAVDKLLEYELIDIFQSKLYIASTKKMTRPRIRRN